MGLKHNALLSHEHVWPSTSYLTVAVASVLSFRVIFIFSCVASYSFAMYVEIGCILELYIVAPVPSCDPETPLPKQYQ